MRFLCVCVAILGGLVAVRCFEVTLNSLKAADNILRRVLAEDKKWMIILIEELEPGEVDFEEKLHELELTPEPNTGIAPSKIIQQLVFSDSTTGTQLMYGVRVLGIALANQFMTTLMVHLYLSLKFSEREEANPESLWTCIAKIQASLVNFSNKAAAFGHSIKIFKELNDEINEFLRTNKSISNTTESNEEEEQQLVAIIKDFLSKLLDTTKENVMKVSHDYKTLDDTEIRDVMRVLKFRNRIPDIIDERINIRTLYAITIDIDDYDFVKVSSIGLPLAKKRFDFNDV